MKFWPLIICTICVLFLLQSCSSIKLSLLLFARLHFQAASPSSQKQIVFPEILDLVHSPNPLLDKGSTGYLGLGEPGLGTCIIFAGVWINRNTTVKELTSSISQRLPFHKIHPHVVLPEQAELDRFVSASTSKRRYSNPTHPPNIWRNRELPLFGCTKTIQTPNTAFWRNTVPSRVLHAFPFLMEVVYWALIYSVRTLLIAFALPASPPF